MACIKRNGLTLLFAFALVVTIVVGVFFTAHFNAAREARNELKPLVSAYPGATSFEKAEELVDGFLSETVSGYLVTIKNAYYAFQGDEKVGVIYYAQTDGYKEDMVIAFAIRYVDHKIVGYAVVESNETPIYLDALLHHETFGEQFAEKAMDVDSFGVDRVSGVTPGGNNQNGTISPATTRAIENAMTLIRKQYEKDSDGAFTIPELAIFVSRRQNVDTFNFEFVYNVKVEGVDTELVITTNHSYTILSVSLPEYDNDAFRTSIRSDISRNHRFNAWVTNVEVTEGVTTVYASAVGFADTITSVITFDASGVITNMTTDTSNESYEYGNWNGISPKDVVPGAIIAANDSEVDGVVTATVTSDAIKATARVAISYVQFMQEVND